MTVKRFTYGDRLRRRNGGTVTVTDIDDAAYHFDDGTFALIEDQDCYTLVEKASGYFRVAKSLYGLPVDKYLYHGYETREEFEHALRRLLEYWSGRVGENIGERNKFLLLRFHDTPGGRPDETWLPLYMLTPCEAPPVVVEEPRDPIEEELDRVFGFE